MEEKLYFKPGNYGKGRKKRQTEQKVDNAPEKKDHKALKLISLLLLLLIIIIIIIWLLRGKTTTTGQYPANVRNEYLTCESSNVAYEKVSSVDSDNKTLKISMIFYGEETFNSASLQYIMKFDTKDKAYSAEAVSHAQFNKGLAAVGLKSEAFNNKFSLMDETLSVAIHASVSDLNETTADYFLIAANENGEMPLTLLDYKSNYEKQGFSCVTSK